MKRSEGEDEESYSSFCAGFIYIQYICVCIYIFMLTVLYIIVSGVDPAFVFSNEVAPDLGPPVRLLSNEIYSSSSFS